MKNLKKVLALVLSLAMVLSLTAAFALADDEPVVDFPDIYPASALYKISDEEVSAKVEALLKTMTEAEMYSMLGGARSGNSRWGWGTGYLAGVARLGVPVIRMWDGPMGVIGPGTLQTNSPVQELGLGATFDTEMAYTYGEIVATENKATAANMQLGSQVDISRDVSTGRSRDTFSEDPLVVALIGGAQSKAYEDNNVAAVLKHYTAYSSYNQNQQQEVDLQTLHEIYLAPFDYILNNNYSHAIMSSYNHVNGYYTSASKYLEITVLRDMWGWDGTSMTDWGGNHEMTVGLGTDLEMGSLSRNSRANVEAAIEAGKITYENEVKTCVRHTLTCLGALGYLNLVQVGADGKAIEDKDPPATIELTYLAENSAERFELLDANAEKALQTALAAPVLLKNEGSALPLQKSDKIALVGISAERSVTGHYSEASFGYLGAWSGLYNEMSAAGYNVTKAIGTNNVFGNTIPAEWLFTDAEATTNGVVVTKKDAEGNETSYTKASLELLTQNHKGYKNVIGGEAVEFGGSATLKTYLKVPADGTYGFKMLNIGGSRNTATIGEVGGRTTSFAATRSGFGKTGVTITETGLDIPANFTNVQLEAGKVYEINIGLGVANAVMDAQCKIVFQSDATRAADEAAMIDAVAKSDKVVFLGYSKNTTMTGLDNTQNAMLQKVIEVAKEYNRKVIVVLECASTFIMDWQDDVDGIVQMWLAGETAAKAEQMLLTGEANFSGRLPITIPGNRETAQPLQPGWNTSGGYREGIYVGYRYYDKYDLPVSYDFGYGLSYTTFGYSDLKVEKVDGETAYDVSFKVKNTGSVAGNETAQVYLGEVAVPAGVQMAKVALAGFAKVKDLAPGEERDVTVRVGERQLSYWYADLPVESEAVEKWVVAAGERKIYVGAASNDLKLSADINVAADTISAANVTAKCGKGEKAAVDVVYNSDKVASSVRVVVGSDFDIANVTSDYEMEYNPATGAVVVYGAEDISAGDVLFTVTYDLDVAPWVADGVYPVTVKVINVTAANETVDLLDVTGIAGSITIVNEYVKGDINRDGTFSNADLIMIARYLVDLEEFDAQQKELADFNDDGIIDNRDLVLIARALVAA